MFDQERLTLIEKRLAANDYFVNPHADVNVQDDIQYLLNLVRKKEENMKILAAQLMELTQEIENVKSDFGGNSR